MYLSTNFLVSKSLTSWKINFDKEELVFDKEREILFLQKGDSFLRKGGRDL